MQLTGKCSTFGGPKDTGVGPHEDLALYEGKDVAAAAPGLFLARQPDGTTGTARRLNPDGYYCAMRWAYTPAQCAKDTNHLGTRLQKCTPRGWLRDNVVSVRANGKTIQVRAVDWGPNGETDRIIDLSPGAAEELGVQTNDEVTVILLE